MRYITTEQIKALGIRPEQCVDWVREAFLMKRECVLPPKISIHPQGSDFINTMPCLLPPRFNRFGCKIVSRIKGSVPSLKSKIMLIDASNGDMIALIDSDWITTMRTGAVAALAINTLRKADAKVYAFVGLGEVGHAALHCLMATNPDKRMVIRLKRYKDHAETTIMEFSRYENAIFEVADTMDALVDGADVIVSSITAADGLLVEDASLFASGVLVVPVHTRGFQNCDTIFEKVFADDEGHVRDFKYFNQFRKFGEIGDVLSGRIAGREGESERILSYNIGLGLHDVYFASQIERLLGDAQL